MADSTGIGSLQDSNFDDFEKLDPLASSGDAFNVSSSNIPNNPLDEDLYTATPKTSAATSQPLVDFGDVTPLQPELTTPIKTEIPAETSSTGSKNLKSKKNQLRDRPLFMAGECAGPGGLRRNFQMSGEGINKLNHQNKH